MSNTASPTTGAECTAVECECRARADAYVASLIGAESATLSWDELHPLQGHVHIGHRELVVIATHDAASRPVVLTSAGWDAVRRSSAEERRTLIAACAITDHAALALGLESDDTEWLATGLGLAA